MTTFVALLRGINVGGKTMIEMEELRGMLETHGFIEARTLMQSGNVVFQSVLSRAAVTKRLEAETEKRFGRHIGLMIRTAAEWKRVVAANPFKIEAANDPSHLLVLFLKQQPKQNSFDALEKVIAGREYFQAKGLELYVVYPDGIGRSKLNNAVIEKQLGTALTARNWNTVQKISKLVDCCPTRDEERF